MSTNNSFAAAIGVEQPGGAITGDLLRSYDRPGPRYTSYPTALEFQSSFDHHAYLRQLDEAASAPNEPLLLHPSAFLRRTMLICGCTVVITRKRQVAEHYLTYLKREIAMLPDRLKARRRVVQYHWGGCTPTCLAPVQMKALHTAVTSRFEIAPAADARDSRISSSAGLPAPAF